MDSREKFEAWVIRILIIDQCQDQTTVHRNGDGYVDDEIEMMWEAWQAARADIVVELPEYHYHGCPCVLVDEVIAAIQSQGVGVK